MTELPLNGVRVVDLGTAAIGPTTTRFLAMMGAEVIKIESLERLDTVRFGSHADDIVEGRFWETGGRHIWSDGAKLSITLDFEKPRGREVLKRLVKISDVVAENYSARVLKNLGLDYESLKEINPGIIMVSMRAYGSSGPRMNDIGYGWSLWAETGLAYLTGYADGPPKATISPYHDYSGGLWSALATVVALDHRRRSGEGQWVDVSMYECGVQQNGVAMLDYIMNQRVQQRMGNRHSSIAPQGVYPCQGDNKWVAISVTSDEEWRALCRAMGDPPWARDERFADVLGRIRHHDELDQRIAEWTTTRGHYEAMHLLQEAGVPAGALLNCKEILLDPHFNARGKFYKVPQAQAEGMEHLGTRIVPGPQFIMSQSPPKMERTHVLGEDNDYVFRELLGMSAEEVEQLVAEGVTGTEPAIARTPLAAGKFNPPVRLMLGQLHEYDEDYKEILGL
ncbi:MAG: CoA transferase [Chloroflexota bacterium]|nr:CoA transferase [Chloroflexota bacterium]